MVPESQQSSPGTKLCRGCGLIFLAAEKYQEVRCEEQNTINTTWKVGWIEAITSIPASNDISLSNTNSSYGDPSSHHGIKLTQSISMRQTTLAFHQLQLPSCCRFFSSSKKSMLDASISNNLYYGWLVPTPSTSWSFFFSTMLKAISSDMSSTIWGFLQIWLPPNHTFLIFIGFYHKPTILEIPSYENPPVIDFIHKGVEISLNHQRIIQLFEPLE